MQVYMKVFFYLLHVNVMLRVFMKIFKVKVRRIKGNFERKGRDHIR